MCFPEASPSNLISAKVCHVETRMQELVKRLPRVDSKTLPWPTLLCSPRLGSISLMNYGKWYLTMMAM